MKRIILFFLFLFIFYSECLGITTLTASSDKKKVATGNQDTFTGTQAALATHDANWTASADGVTNFEIDGSGNLRLTGNYRSASAYYNTGSPTDISIATVAAGSTNQYTYMQVCVRMSGASRGYCLRLHDNNGTNWTDISVNKAGSTICYLTPGTLPANTTHTLEITASGTSTVTLTASIDGTPVGTCDSGSLVDSSTPIESGYSGLAILGGSAADYTNNRFTDWRDYE